MVTPQRKLPLSCSISPARIWKRVVFARLSSPTKAILPPLLTLREMLFRTGTPSISFPSPLISRIISPQGRSGLKSMNGYLRDETGISSMVSFSRRFFLEVACFALEALALKRWMNAFNSSALAVIFFCRFLSVLDGVDLSGTRNRSFRHIPGCDRSLYPPRGCRPDSGNGGHERL